MSIHIREARREDASLIVRLITELAVGTGEVSPISPAYVKTYLASPTSGVLLTEAQGQVIGLLSYSVRPDLYHAANCCLIEELVVREGLRGQGVGSALLQALFSRMQECAEVGLGVMPENERAIRFYRKHGFVDEALLLEKHSQKNAK